MEIKINNDMKKRKEYCPYCGSKRIIIIKLPHGACIDPAPSIITVIKNVFHKLYKCEDCGKEFS